MIENSNRKLNADSNRVDRAVTLARSARFAFTITSLFLAIGTTLVMFAALPRANAQPTILCRDCPFPIREASNRWLMPNKHVEIVMDTDDVDPKTVVVHVRLRDAHTHKTLATGTAKVGRYSRGINMRLFGRNGNPIRGVIYFVNFEKSIIQAKFECADDDCSIDELLR